MIQLAKLQFNPYGENTYLLFDETKQAIIIDCGTSSEAEFLRLVDFVEKNQLQPIMVVATHGHIDHICGIYDCVEKWAIPFAMHSADQPFLDCAIEYGATLGFKLNGVPRVDIDLAQQKTIALGNHTIEVVATPGHSLGGVCLHVPSQKLLISGDTLFAGSIGRTDLAGGDYNQLMHSIINELLVLDGATKVFPGHASDTSIGQEGLYNPFITDVMQGEFKYE
ncbi:MAG: MBL fold metallo-hydrolase [Rikenellaceae bacterium]